MPEQVGRALSGTELWLADGFGEETGWSTHAWAQKEEPDKSPAHTRLLFHAELLCASLWLGCPPALSVAGVAASVLGVQQGI